MNRNEVALQIFLKRMSTEPLTEKTRKGFESVLDQSFEIADLFLKQAGKIIVLTNLSEGELKL